MATFDIFNQDAFKQQELIGAVEQMEYVPSTLSDMNIFTKRPVRTEMVSIEKRDTKFSLIQTSPRGAPLDQLTQSKRNIRDFRTARIAKGDRVTASELANVRAFGSESELKQVQQEVAMRMSMLRSEIAMTKENMMLGAIQGLVKDADGSTIYNWHQEWGNGSSTITSVNFDFATISSDEGAFRDKVNKMKRAMVRESGGLLTVNSRIVAFCSDDFWDALVKLPENRDRFLNAEQSKFVQGGGAFDSFDWYGITWVNYQSTDDGTTVTIPAGEAYFFPVNTNGVFIEVMSPGEQLEQIGQLGRELYPLIVRDLQRDSYVDIELYSYPLYVCTVPKMLRKGTIA